MPSTFSVGGLVSGIDFNDLIDQIISIDRRSIDLLELRQDQYESQKSALEELNGLLLSLNTQVESLNDVEAFDVFSSVLSSSSSSVDAGDLLSVTADKDANPGTFSVKVNQLAEARKLSSGSFTSASTALGLSGEVLINGEVLSIDTTDSLQDIKGAINNLDADVTATVISLSSTDNRLILTGQETGADKFSILDASTTDVLQSLGLAGTSTTVKNLDSGGSLSDAFSSISTSVSDMLGLSSANSGTVTIHAGKPAEFTVTIDLSKSLTALEADIDAAAGSDIASIESTTEDGVTTYRLKIASTSFTDDNNVLQTMGFLEGGGEVSVAQILTGSVQNTEGGSSITASTRFKDIDGAGVTNGDTITIQGTDHDGNSVSGTYTVANVNNDTVGDLLTEIESVFGNTVTAAVVNGKIQVTDDTSGDSQLSLQLVENNEGGGSLDFGDMTVTTVGETTVGLGSVAEVLTGSEQNTSGGSAITAATEILNIDNASVADGDTITIKGKDHLGNSVTTVSFSITAGTTVGDLLSEIETVFGLDSGSATVSASGEIVVTDSTSGESLLSVQLIANNEGGGTLDFGDMEVTTQGYDIELATGQDASLTVDGVTVSRSSNTVDDIVEGVTLNLHKADVNTTVTVQINRDVDTIAQTVQGVVDAYNSVVDFINQQNLFDEEDETSGVLQGDPTLLSVRSSLINVITSPVSGITSDINALSIVGINSDRNGKLSLDTSTFSSYLRSDFDEVKNLFLVDATATDSNVDYVSSDEGTEPGTYDISITQLATQSSVTGTQDLSGGLSGATALTVTFDSTGAQAVVNFEAGDDIDVIVDRINTEFDQRAQETHVADVQNLSGGSAVQSPTTFSAIDGASVTAGDTVSFTGTDRLGNFVSGVYSIDDPTTDTIGAFMSFVENAFDNEVDVSLDDGYLVAKDINTGASQVTLTVTENNEGGGSLDFGTLSTSNSSTNETGEEGRAQIPITASKDGSNQLVLTADSYGSANTFTVTDSSDLGIFASNYTSGVDVAGTINGESATGAGQVLRGDGGDGAATDGLSILVAGTSTGSRGTISITKGVTEQLEELLNFFTASVTGNIPTRIDSIESSIDFIDDRIERQEDRLESKRERLTKQFVNMETTLASLQAINSFISQSLLQLSA